MFNQLNVKMINQYETVFIANPVLSVTQMKEAVEKFKNIIKDGGGEILHEEDWGLKKLAYPIQKKSTGFYYLIEFRVESAFIAKFETEYRRDERIMRFQTVKLDKYGVEYNERKRSLKQAQKKEE